MASTNIECASSTSIHMQSTIYPSETQLVHDGTHRRSDVGCGESGTASQARQGVGWIGTTVLMVQAQVGLGVLALPQAFHTLGLLPGVVCLIGITLLATWVGWVIGDFKLRHPEVYGVDDVGRMLFGRVGAEVLTVAFLFSFLFPAGGAIMSISIGLNSLSTHGACTAVFVAVAAIAASCFASIKTLNRISWVAWLGAISIIVALLALSIAVGVERGNKASDFQLIGSPTFLDTIAAVSVMLNTYTSLPGYFTIQAEMRDPRLYHKSLVTSQGILFILYFTVSVVVYYFCGSQTASPALGSAGPVMKIVCYGIAMPGLLAFAMLMIHIPSKRIFLRITDFKAENLEFNGLPHWLTWLGVTVTTTAVAYVLASGIPTFQSLVSLSASLFSSLVMLCAMGCAWLFDNWGLITQSKKSLWCDLKVAWCCFVTALGVFLMIAGTYASIVQMINSEHTSPWSCADNSNSV